MYSVDLSGVTYAYSDAVPLLRDVSLHLVPGWTAVVGPNGAGKTTLLRLLARELAPDAGAIRFHPDGLRVRLCAQSVERLEADLCAFAECDEGAARELRGRLALGPADLVRWATLSPGERKRWQVGAALAAEPGLLLLDEPTNHLDAQARELLHGALERYRGIGLVVSHDRALLNALASSTLRFHQGSVTSYSGGYDEARGTWQALEREKREAHARIRSEQRKLERRLGDRHDRRARAEASMRTSRRMKSPHDSDARLRFKQTRRRSAMLALGREIDLVHGRLDRLADREREFSFDKAKGSALFVDWVCAPLPRLLALDASAIRAGDRTLLEDVHVEVGRETRVRLAGPNGSGKTTLLNHLIAASRLPRSKLLYLPQELGDAESLDLLCQARALDAAERGRLMSLVAALGVDPEALLESARPSPGEARKLALAMGLSRQVWLALLDEPTNHLDLPSIERLEEALAAYPGALVVITHDDAFARRLTRDVWEIRADRLERLPRAD